MVSISGEQLVDIAAGYTQTPLMIRVERICRPFGHRVASLLLAARKQAPFSLCETEDRKFLGWIETEHRPLPRNFLFFVGVICPLGRLKVNSNTHRNYANQKARSQCLKACNRSKIHV